MWAIKTEAIDEFPIAISSNYLSVCHGTTTDESQGGRVGI